MQSVSSQFTQDATSQVRPLAWDLSISFNKVFDTGIIFFELDTSTLDGTDVLAPTGGNVIAEWDKYEYISYSDRVISLEWQREENVPYSVNLAIADVVLNNYDDYFTHGSSSPIAADLLPRRPVKILSGFGTETIPQFNGLSETVPKTDKISRTASFHAEDFLSFLFNKPLNRVTVFQDKYTHEVLDELFTFFGLLPNQYNLDDSSNLLNFVYFEKDMKLGDAIRKLMQAEMGSLFMDEFGIIQFRNRLRQPGSSVYTFNKSNTVNFEASDEGDIVNVVEIRSDVREVQNTQPVFTLGASVTINGNTTTEAFFDFQDPVTSLETIDQFTANTSEDGSGDDITGNISVTDIDIFSKAAKVTFTNSGQAGFLTDIVIYGTPAKVVKTIDLRLQDDTSVDKYEERVLFIDNNFIQDDNSATSLGLSILNYYKEYGNTIKLGVKGSPALQLGDSITIDIDDIQDEFVISKISNVLTDGQFRQTLTAKNYNLPDYFVLDSSELDGAEVLAP